MSVFFGFTRGKLIIPPVHMRHAGQIRPAMALDTGARGLRSVVEEFMLDLMYELPEAKQPGGAYVITQAMVESGQKPTLKTARTKKKESA